MPKQSSPAAEVRRARDQALAAVRDPVFVSQIGLLHHTGQLTLPQYSTSKRWAALTSEYNIATLGPRAPSSVCFDARGGDPVDPASTRGAREAHRHRQVTATYLQARAALSRAGVLRIVDSIVVQDRTPTSGELAKIREGLQVLNSLWSEKRRATAQLRQPL